MSISTSALFAGLGRILHVAVVGRLMPGAQAALEDDAVAAAGR